MMSMTIQTAPWWPEPDARPVSDAEVQAWVLLAHRIAETAQPPARVEALYAAVNAFYRSVGSQRCLHRTNAEEVAQLDEVQNLLITLQARVAAAMAHPAHTTPVIGDDKLRLAGEEVLSLARSRTSCDVQAGWSVG